MHYIIYKQNGCDDEFDYKISLIIKPSGGCCLRIFGREGYDDAIVSGVLHDRCHFFGQYRS